VFLFIILVKIQRLLAVSLYPAPHYYVRKHGMYCVEHKNSLTNGTWNFFRTNCRYFKHFRTEVV